jgi:hypothetical protein
MDNERDQSKVAYGDGIKEVRVEKGMPSGDRQFGKNKMPQGSSPAKAKDVKSSNRHKEHR